MSKPSVDLQHHRSERDPVGGVRTPHTKHNDYLEKLAAGELDPEAKRKKLLDAYAEDLSVRRHEWKDIQVSLVAGA